MLYAWGMGLAKDVRYSLKPLSPQAARSHPGKTRSYKPKALWGERKSHYFTHPAQDTTNSHPHFNRK